MSRQALVMFRLFLLAIGSALLAEDTLFSTLRIEVVGPFGKKIEDPRIRLLTENRKELPADPGGNTFSQVPYGEYILKILGFPRVERRIVVNVPEIWIKCGVPVRYGDRAVPGGDLILGGIITPTPVNPSTWWVKIEGVFLDFRREVVIDREGRFSVGGLDMGTYAVHVFEDKELRSTRTVEIDPKRPKTELSIELPQQRTSAK